MAKKNDWVVITRVVLNPSERAAAVPEDTASTPLVMWVKGRLEADAEIGDEVTVVTRTGRLEHGKLVEVNPHYELGYGDFVPELLDVGDTVRDRLFGEGR